MMVDCAICGQVMKPTHDTPALGGVTVAVAHPGCVTELARLRAEAKELRAALRDILRRTRRGDPLGEIASAALKGEP